MLTSIYNKGARCFPHLWSTPSAISQRRRVRPSQPTRRIQSIRRRSFQRGLELRTRSRIEAVLEWVRANMTRYSNSTSLHLVELNLDQDQWNASPISKRWSLKEARHILILLADQGSRLGSWTRPETWELLKFVEAFTHPLIGQTDWSAYTERYNIKRTNKAAQARVKTIRDSISQPENGAIRQFVAEHTIDGAVQWAHWETSAQRPSSGITQRHAAFRWESELKYSSRPEDSAIQRFVAEHNVDGAVQWADWDASSQGQSSGITQRHAVFRWNDALRYEQR